MSEEPGRYSASEGLRDSASASKETPSQEASRLYEFGPFLLDAVERKLLRGNEIVALTPKAFDTLLLLVRNSGRLLEKDELIRTLWPNTFVEEGSLSNNIFLLRKALGEDPMFIETVPRRGYRFIAPVDSPAMPVRVEIEEAGAALATAESGASMKVIRAHRRGVLLWGIGFLLLVGVTSIDVWNRKSTSPMNSGPVSRIAIALPPGQQLAGMGDAPAIALSPDGTQLVYIAQQGGAQQLYLRAMDSVEAKPISHTEGAVNPFFSPDGKWLGFFADGKLKKISMSGGAALTLGDAADPGGASWSNQGLIAFAPSRVSGLQQVSDSGGMTQPMTRLENRQANHRWPDFLPGGKALLFAAGMARLNFTNPQVAVQLIGTGERRNLIQAGTNPRYAPSGHLIYAQGGTLMAVPFDPRRLLVMGMAVSVVEGVQQSPATGAAQYSFSATGSLVYVPGSSRGAQSKLVWVSRNGAEQPLPAPARGYSHPQLSPDGRRIAVPIEEQESQVWVYDLSRETLTRLTFDGNTNYSSAWTPDGKRIAFQSNKEGASNIFLATVRREWRLGAFD